MSLAQTEGDKNRTNGTLNENPNAPVMPHMPHGDWAHERLKGLRHAWGWGMGFSLGLSYGWDFFESSRLGALALVFSDSV